MTAACRGVQPLLSVAFTSAPLEMSSSAISFFPALYKGVQSFTSFVLTFAPASRCCLMDAMFPFIAASSSALFAAGFAGFISLAACTVGFDSAGGDGCCAGTSATGSEGCASTGGVAVATGGSGLAVSATGSISFTSVGLRVVFCCDSPHPANRTAAIVVMISFMG